MRPLFTALILALPVSAAELTVDVCIYGATPGGIAAAVAAARSGSTVLLLEPTARIGGLLASGLSHTDYHSRESLTGSFLEFSKRVKAHYERTYGADSQQVKDSHEGVFGEPRVNLLVLEQMLAEQERVTLRKGAALKSVQVARAVISQAEFAQGAETFMVRAAVFVDGSYEGDLMAAAGVRYHVGREGRDVYGESLAPEKSDKELQAYNFRFCATDDPANRAPIQAPKGYRREDFLDVLPILESGKIQSVFGYPSGCVVKAQPPALPNRKYDINDVSRGLIRLSMPGANLAWPEGDAAARQAIFDEHLRYNAGLLFFLANDEAVPARFREPASQWGWCKDEFTETGHLPPQLYVREARRMTGRHVYVQQDSEHAPGDARAKLFKDAIAMGDYGNNCHGTSHKGPLIGGSHGGEFYNPVPPYQVPYGALVPNELENLLVPVAVSSSHVGFCALRLEPIWMSLGQAAGHAAAMAAATKLAVDAVPVGELQKRLHKDGSATLYVSDVPPGHPHFEAVQWWGTAGGLHGLNPMPEKPGQRGKNLHGQYFEANPGHALEPLKPLDRDTHDRWLILANELDAYSSQLEKAPTRIDFILAARSAAEKAAR
ncbi:MAG TPA: FAD-dependent oxidoreductase [Prosthecobacter sp.]|nr:FAD-dependent oxidoreductase [Prosthecobacter sp.]HRK15980.1 FAD-dependent oxidoreductase [Prosthecobacter sp.]